LSTLQINQLQTNPILPIDPLLVLVEQVLARLQLADRQVGVTLVDDVRSHALNRDYLGRDRPTNVLSFPADESEELGEVIVNVDYAVREANEAGVTTLAAVGYYIVHGLLHLAGYDHEDVDEVEARRMEAMQESMQDLLAALTTVEDRE